MVLAGSITYLVMSTDGLLGLAVNNAVEETKPENLAVHADQDCPFWLTCLDLPRLA